MGGIYPHMGRIDSQMGRIDSMIMPVGLILWWLQWIDINLA
jgi:hypothetical protein